MHCCLMMKLFTGSMTGAGSKGKGRVWVEKDLTSTDICHLIHLISLTFASAEVSETLAFLQKFSLFLAFKRTAPCSMTHMTVP